MSRFRPAAAIERQKHDWGIFAQVSGPRDGLAGIVAIEATSSRGRPTRSTFTPARRR